MNTNKSDKIMEIIFSMTGAITILILLIITGYILIKGMPHMSLEFLLTNPLDAVKMVEYSL